MQKRRLLASAALAITALGCGATSLSRTAGAAESPKQAPADNRRIAVVYFTKTGNTKSLAEAVRHMARRSFASRPSSPIRKAMVPPPRS